MDHLDTDEMPPAWMWPFDNLLNDHLDEVRAKRKDPNSSKDEPEIPAGSVTIQNELAKGRGRNA